MVENWKKKKWKGEYEDQAEKKSYSQVGDDRPGQSMKICSIWSASGAPKVSISVIEPSLGAYKLHSWVTVCCLCVWKKNNLSWKDQQLMQQLWSVGRDRWWLSLCFWHLDRKMTTWDRESFFVHTIQSNSVKRKSLRSTLWFLNLFDSDGHSKWAY